MEVLHSIWIKFPANFLSLHWEVNGVHPSINYCVHVKRTKNSQCFHFQVRVVMNSQCFHRLRVVPLLPSLLSETQKKPARKKWPLEILGARSTRKAFQKSLWLAENTKRVLCDCPENWAFPKVAILGVGADQKKRGLNWGREWWARRSLAKMFRRHL